MCVCPAYVCVCPAYVCECVLRMCVNVSCICVFCHSCTCVLSTCPARSWPMCRHAHMHACWGTSTVRSHSFCTNSGWRDAAALKHNVRSIGGHKKRKVYSQALDSGSNYSSGMCKRKRTESAHQWSAEAPPGGLDRPVCDSDTGVIQSMDLPSETGVFICEGDSGENSEGYSTGGGEVGSKPGVVGREGGGSECCGDVPAAAATVAAEAAADVGQGGIGHTRKYLTYNMSGSCMMVHSMDPTLTDMTYTIETVEETSPNPLPFHSSSDTSSSEASISPVQYSDADSSSDEDNISPAQQSGPDNGSDEENINPVHHSDSDSSSDESKISGVEQTEPRQEAVLRKYVCYNMDGACMMVHSMDPTSPLSDIATSSDNSDVNPDLFEVADEGWSSPTQHCHPYGDTGDVLTGDFAQETESDVDTFFARAESEPVGFHGQVWEDVEAQLNRMAVNDTYLIADNAQEYDSDIKYIKMSDYVCITQEPMPSCTPGFDFPVDGGVLVAWDTEDTEDTEEVVPPHEDAEAVPSHDSELRSVVEDSVQMSHDLSGDGVVSESVIIEGEMSSQSAPMCIDDTGEVTSCPKVEISPELVTNSLAQVVKDDFDNNNLVTDRVLSEQVTPGGDVSDSHDQVMGSGSGKEWDARKDRKLMFDSVGDDSWVHAMVTHMGSLEMSVGDSVAVSSKDKSSAADDESKLADDFCPAAGDSPRQSALWGVLRVGLSSVHDAFSKMANDHQSNVVGQLLTKHDDVKAALTPPKVKIFRKGRARVAPLSVAQVCSPLFRSTPIGDEERGLGATGGCHLLEANDATRSGSASPFSDHGPFWSSPAADVNPPSPPLQVHLFESSTGASLGCEQSHTRDKTGLLPLKDDLTQRLPVGADNMVGVPVDSAMTFGEPQNYDKQVCIVKPEPYLESVIKDMNVCPEAITCPVADPRHIRDTSGKLSLSVEEVRCGLQPSSGLQSRLSLPGAGSSAFYKVCANPVADEDSNRTSDVCQLSLPRSQLSVGGSKEPQHFLHQTVGPAVTKGMSDQTIGAKNPPEYDAKGVNNLRPSSVEHNRNENNISNSEENFGEVLCKESGAVQKTTLPTVKRNAVPEHGMPVEGENVFTNTKNRLGKRRSSLSNFASNLIRRLSLRGQRSQVTCAPEVVNRRTGTSRSSEYQCLHIDIDCKPSEQSFHSPIDGFTSPTFEKNDKHVEAKKDAPEASGVDSKLSQHVSGSAVCWQDEITVEPSPADPVPAKVTPTRAKPMSPIVTYIQHLKKRGRVPPSIRNLMRKYSIFGEGRRSRKSSEKRKQWEKTPGTIHIARQLSNSDITQLSCHSPENCPVKHYGMETQTSVDTSKLPAQHGADVEPSMSEDKHITRHVSIKDILKKKFRHQTNTSRDMLPADNSVAGEAKSHDQIPQKRQRSTSVWTRLSSVLSKRSSVQRQHMKKVKSDSALENRGFVNDSTTGESVRNVSKVMEHSKGDATYPLPGNIAVTVQTEVTFFDRFRKNGNDKLGGERSILPVSQLEADRSRQLIKSTGCNDLVTLYSLERASRLRWMHSGVCHRDVAAYPMRSLSPSQIYINEGPTVTEPVMHTKTESGQGMRNDEKYAGNKTTGWESAGEVAEEVLPEFVVEDRLDVPPPIAPIVIRDSYSPVHLSGASSMTMFTPTRVTSLSRVSSSMGHRTPVLQDWDGTRGSSSNMTLFSTKSFTSTGLDNSHSTDIYYTPVSFLEDPSRFSSPTSENFYSPLPFFLPNIGRMSSSFVETPTIVIDASSSSDEESCASQFVPCPMSRESGQSPSGSQKTLEAEPIESVSTAADNNGGYFRPILAGVSGILSSAKTGYEYLLGEGTGSAGLSSYSGRLAALFGPMTTEGDKQRSCEGHNPVSDAGNSQCPSAGDNTVPTDGTRPESNDGVGVKSNDAVDPKSNEGVGVKSNDAVDPKSSEGNDPNSDGLKPNRDVPKADKGDDPESNLREDPVSDGPKSNRGDGPQSNRGDGPQSDEGDDPKSELGDCPWINVPRREKPMTVHTEPHSGDPLEMKPAELEVKTSSSSSITSGSSSIPVHSTRSSSSGEHCSCSDATTDGSVNSVRSGNSEQFRTLLSNSSHNAASLYYSIVNMEPMPLGDDTQG